MRPRRDALVFVLLGAALHAAAGCAHRDRPFVPAGVPRFAEPAPKRGEIDVSILLIGDAGAPAPGGEPVLHALGARARELAGPPGDVAAGSRPEVVVLFLGDNIYPEGMPAPGAGARRADAERRLDAQLEVLEQSGAKGYFLAGNHDWDEEGPHGWEAVKRQTEYVNRANAGRAEMLPGDGDPMPCARAHGRGLIILLDTQWWLHPGARPDVPEDEVLDALDGHLAGAAPGQVVIVAGHHPLATRGPHGGHFGWQDYLLFPVALFRWMGFSRQDLANSKYGELVDTLESVMGDRPLIYASGHEHSLQVFRPDHGPRYLLVSGAGSETNLTPVGRDATTLFAYEHAGFMEVDLLEDGRVFLRVFASTPEGRADLVFSHFLSLRRED